MAPTKPSGGTKKSQGRNAPAPRKTPRAAPTTTAKTKKKTGTKKPAPNESSGTFHEVKKTVLGIVILLAVCLTTAMLIDIFIRTRRSVVPKNQTDRKEQPVAQSPGPAPPLPRQKAPASVEPQIITRTEGFKEKELSGRKGGRAQTPAPKEGGAIVYEVYDDVAPLPPKKVVPPPKNNVMPQIAIIIDDIGYDKDLAMGLFNLDKNITFSILPFSPAGIQLAHSLSAKGAELMLHLPMEPTQYPKVNPGPGALLSSMSPDELLSQLRKDIKAVPGTVGVNNHMGSRLTTDADTMNQIFTVLKKNNLYFVDSRTSAESKGEQSARMFQLEFSHRDVFLDNSQDIEYISGQIEKLIKQAQIHGSAIGIGHPHKATLEALKRELPKFKGKVQVVPAGNLVEVPKS